MYDAHIHLFPARLFRAVWQWFEKGGIKLPFSGISQGRITGHLKDMGVEKAFLLVYAHKADVSEGVNLWLSQFCRDNPIYLPFGCVHPHDQNLPAVIEDALDRFGFYGLKLHFLVNGMRADDPAFRPVYKALSDRARMLVAHAGTGPIPRPWLGLDIFERVLCAYPDMIVQLAHLGHFELQKVAALMRKYPNLYLDTAWALGNSLYEVDPVQVSEIILEFPDRVMYGSDFPIVPEDPADAVDRILRLGLPPEVTGAVFRGNAARLAEMLKHKSAEFPG